ncbi:hypothetical protein BaRGS_00035541, partial [Batillaria attramentaria]
MNVRQVSEMNVRQVSEESARQVPVSKEDVRQVSEEGVRQVSEEDVRHGNEEGVRQVSEESLRQVSEEDVRHVSEERVRQVREESETGEWGKCETGERGEYEVSSVSVSIIHYSYYVDRYVTEVLMCGSSQEEVQKCIYQLRRTFTESSGHYFIYQLRQSIWHYFLSADRYVDREYLSLFSLSPETYIDGQRVSVTIFCQLIGIKHIVKAAEPVPREQAHLIQKKMERCRNQENNPESEVYKTKMADLFDDEEETRSQKRARRDEEQIVTYFLTVAEERLLVRQYEFVLKEFWNKFQPPAPKCILGTSLAFFKRFWVNNSVMDYHPKDI